MSKAVKKRKVGRPAGSNKEPLNIYIHKERAAKLRELAVSDQRTVSVMVERALENTYGI
jgi:hypothetical protein